MNPKSDKELADELDARDRLRARGMIWIPCQKCHGVRTHHCFSCQNNGGHWQSPMERANLAPTGETWDDIEQRSRTWWGKFKSKKP